MPRLSLLLLSRGRLRSPTRMAATIRTRDRRIGTGTVKAMTGVGTFDQLVPLLAMELLCGILIRSTRMIMRLETATIGNPRARWVCSKSTGCSHTSR